MTTNYSDGTAAGTGGLSSEPRRPPRRLSTETKASYKTTELFAYLAAVVGVLLASQLIGTEDGHDDYFRADRAWLYIVLLTIGYMLSRGLAKAGSRDPYDADGHRYRKRDALGARLVIGGRAHRNVTSGPNHEPELADWAAAVPGRVLAEEVCTRVTRL